MAAPTVVEICAGGGGQALGLEQAGFRHVAAIEYEPTYCKVLKDNRPEWNVVCADIADVNGKEYSGVDLLAGGVPCPPFSIAGKQKGASDERDLFPEALRLIREIQPRAVMLENVRGFLDPQFDEYRGHILAELVRMGYAAQIALLQASSFGVPQLRPRVVITAFKQQQQGPTVREGTQSKAPTVGAALLDLMAAGGWERAQEWAAGANDIAPTIVGGSTKHGGPDLGPVRARRAWAKLGVDGAGVANEPPGTGFEGMPRLTPRMIARLQGFPDDWGFKTSKTRACRMIGNAFPPPVARAVGLGIRQVLEQ